MLTSVGVVRAPDTPHTAEVLWACERRELNKRRRKQADLI